MARGRNAVLAGIATRLTDGISLETAAMRTEYRLSKATIASLRRGCCGRERTARTFAEGMVGRILSVYGNEVKAFSGGPDQDLRKWAVEWFVAQAGFPISGPVDPRAEVFLRKWGYSDPLLQEAFRRDLLALLAPAE
jgi:hypothetical protein